MLPLKNNWRAGDSSLASKLLEFIVVFRAAHFVIDDFCEGVLVSLIQSCGEL